MSLEILTIKYETTTARTYDGTAKALFNPNKLSYQRSPVWQPIQPATLSTTGKRFRMQFQKITPATLTLDLFFDTYDPTSSSSLSSAFSSLTSSASPESVLDYTSKIEALADCMSDLHRPPACELYWGGSAAFFTGVVTQLSTSLELFHENGTPLRATMSCTFADISQSEELNSPDVAKTYVVQPKDTLILIAQKLYGGTSQWRVIAEANGIDNPRVLTPGQVLAIPALQ